MTLLPVFVHHYYTQHFQMGIEGEFPPIAFPDDANE